MPVQSLTLPRSTISHCSHCLLPQMLFLCGERVMLRVQWLKRIAYLIISRCYPLRKSQNESGDFKAVTDAKVRYSYVTFMHNLHTASRTCSHISMTYFASNPSLCSPGNTCIVGPCILHSHGSCLGNSYPFLKLSSLQ